MPQKFNVRNQLHTLKQKKSWKNIGKKISEMNISFIFLQKVLITVQTLLLRENDNTYCIVFTLCYKKKNQFSGAAMHELLLLLPQCTLFKYVSECSESKNCFDFYVFADVRIWRCLYIKCCIASPYIWI